MRAGLALDKGGMRRVVACAPSCLRVGPYSTTRSRSRGGCQGSLHSAQTGFPE